MDIAAWDRFFPDPGCPTLVTWPRRFRVLVRGDGGGGGGTSDVRNRSFRGIQGGVSVLGLRSSSYLSGDLTRVKWSQTRRGADLGEVDSRLLDRGLVGVRLYG